MKRLLISIVVWLAFSVVAFAQCPAGTQQWLYTQDSGNNIHTVACLNSSTGAVTWVGTAPASVSVQAAITDTGGQKFNVKAYGAVGNGIVDETAAFNSTLAATGTNGGTIFFPPGTYLFSGSPNQFTNTKVSVECPNPDSTTIKFTGSAGFVFSYGRVFPYLGPKVSGCKFDMTSALAGVAAVKILDSEGLIVYGNSFFGGDTGVLLEDSAAWCERNQIISNSFYNQSVAGIKFQFDVGDVYNSFAYNILVYNHFQIGNANQSGILATGAGLIYSNYWVIRANTSSGTNTNVVRFSNSMQGKGNYIDIQSEGPSGSALLCLDAGTTGAFYGFLRPNTSDAYLCTGSVQPQFSFTQNDASNVNFYTSGGVGIGMSITPGTASYVGRTWTSGTGVPSAGNCTASNTGSIYSRVDGGTGTSFYVCEGTTNTWVAK